MKVHLISHTHWDREWFITHEYTDEWLVILFNKLLQLIENNGDYRFVLDGQTLLLEDLIRLRPDLENKVKEYVKSGNLLIGPHYCQIDWRIASESAILMNFIIGERDSEKFGGRMKIGWLLDNFGHISQTTQLHKLFDLEGVFVWRG
ncbi:MAG TPA: alpha-mannosidase, partial [Thermotogales bacterium]|nr:alpha-mannosidase [Thermotogales bacterium]